MTGRLRAFSLLLFALLFIAFPGCDCTDSGAATYTTPCSEDSQCASHERCISGYCAADPGAQDVGTGDIDPPDARDGSPDVDDAGEDASHGADAGDNSDNGDDPPSGDDDCPHRLSCEDLEAECGLHPDGCGGTIRCGECGVGQACGTDQERGQCVTSRCTPRQDCGDLQCGLIPDGCGGLIECGSCPSGEFCGIGDNLGRCISAQLCSPRTCQDAGAQCGIISDGCGGTLNCGDCETGEACGTGLDRGQCLAPACTPKTCAELGAVCGRQPDGCGGLTPDCGACDGDKVCGTGPDAGTCVTRQCVPKTCADYAGEANCGVMPDGCGGVTGVCGTCTAPEICGGSGIPNRCGAESRGDCNRELCEHQAICPNGGATTIRGTVVAPNGKLPIPNAVVYVPGVPLSQLPEIQSGAVCQQCEDEDLGEPLVSATTDFDGTFELRHVPANVAFPLVIKIGKWRRLITIPPQAACGDVDLDTSLSAPAGEKPLHLPRRPGTASDGGDQRYDRIPKIAISTGQIDAMECVFYKLGVERAQFTRPSQNGAIHMYRANGGVPDQTLANACAQNKGFLGLGGRVCTGFECTDTSPSCDSNSALENILAHHLYGNQARLNSYDMVVMDCEASSYARSAQDKNRIRNYLNSGGRLFASHYAVDWLTDNQELNDPYYLSGLNTLPNESLGFVNTSQAAHPWGPNFWSWLQVVDADHPVPGPNGEPQIHIRDPRDFVAGIDTDLARGWVHVDSTAPGHANIDSVQQFTFDTPVHAAPNQQCGRVAYSAFHVAVDNTGSSLNTGGGPAFPSYCSSGDLTAQEKVLAYMLFDLANCVSESMVPTPPVCTPRSCADMGAQCGIISDGCGGTVNCGSCEDGQVCGGHTLEETNLCVSPCSPLTCEDHGAACGQIPDGCGETLDCGACPHGQSCGGGGVPNQCGCEPLSCAEQGAQCGTISDGCGSTISCGDCGPGQLCGGGGVPNICSCTPLTCKDHNAGCGQVPDGCGGILECGTCDDPSSCGGGGIPNTCGCEPLTCEDHGATCGTVSDGCGQTLECGTCDGDMLCENNQCVEPACRPAGEECTRSSQCCSRICGAGVCVVN